MKLDTMPDTLEVNFGRKSTFYPVIKKPYPHILVETQKELHGWWDNFEKSGRRACTAERLLVNPYNGCSHDCIFCYAHGMWGYFTYFRKHKIVTVFKDFDKVISKQLDKLNLASTGYLSAVTDPFQPLENKYKLSQKIIDEFIKRNIPVDFVTKGKVPNKVINIIKSQEHSFGQVSIITPDEGKRKLLIKGDGATTEVLFKNIKRLADNGIYAVCRIDPIIPEITDDLDDLEALVKRAADNGAKHVIASIMDIPRAIKAPLMEGLISIDPKVEDYYKDIYTENIGNDSHAEIHYRKRVGQLLKDICSKHGLTFALCMEFEIYKQKDGARYQNLNKYCMTSYNCEGKNTPIYVREEDSFYPVENCVGNCIACKTPTCKIDDLSKGGNWKLNDYVRWSKQIRMKKIEEFAR